MATLKEARTRLLPYLRLYAGDNGEISREVFKTGLIENDIGADPRTFKNHWESFHQSTHLPGVESRAGGWFDWGYDDVRLVVGSGEWSRPRDMERSVAGGRTASMG